MIDQLIEVLQQIKEERGNIPVYLTLDLKGPYHFLSEILTYENEEENKWGVVLKADPE